MTPLAPHLEEFLCRHLPAVRKLSPHTIASYADSLMQLVIFARQRSGTAPEKLRVEHLDSALVLSFLDELETKRGLSPASRNVRLSGVKALMRFIATRDPSSLDLVRRILAIPRTKTTTRLVPFLTPPEARALLAVPDPGTRQGCRDRAMLLLGLACGLRASEIVGLRLDGIVFGPASSLRVIGKGRKERVLPLGADTVRALRQWLDMRGDSPLPQCFLNCRQGPLTRWGFSHILRRSRGPLVQTCVSAEAKRLSPHVLRHTCAMNVLTATKDLRKVALWLGHESITTTEIYTRASPEEKFAVLQELVPFALRRGRFRPADTVLALLRSASSPGP